jgi:hypothetical protein
MTVSAVFDSARDARDAGIASLMRPPVGKGCGTRPEFAPRHGGCAWLARAGSADDVGRMDVPEPGYPDPRRSNTTF